MTKIKPFYIKRTEGMTNQMIQDVFDKCVIAGAYGEERPTGTETTIEYKNKMSSTYRYFGLDSNELFTVLYDKPTSFGEGAIEITLDQLDEHLGISKPKEPKFKYVQVKDFSFDLRDEFEHGELYCQLLGDSGEYRVIEELDSFVDEFSDHNVYRRVELTEEDELAEVIHSIIVDWNAISSNGTLSKYLAKSGKLKLKK